MSFSDHKITKFTHTVSELPDQPSLPPKDLKARFDSSPEELREAVNGICDDAERLDGRVSGIITQTFGDAIPRSMLSRELQAEIEAKAEQSALTELETHFSNQEAVLAKKCEVNFGTYDGDGTATRTISLGFTPLVVICVQDGTYWEYNSNYAHGGIAFTGKPANWKGDSTIAITEGGFTVYQGGAVNCNMQKKTYHYIVFH
ncbi:hypothetical protein [Agathobaculum sp.]|uniref:hypothetical protein n=1 Tax=Agathobaculum sp. TaxID=2048138 RepID=UPI002A7F2598|nr:hypothetical protein [Agathobaculum sp.]MDY3617394.1 hypothetical protein [Agathobaculum sp.]